MLTVTFGGDPLELKNRQLAVGDKLPDARLFDNHMTSFDISSTKGLRVFLTLPSLDTPVCDLEVRTFNQKASELPGVTIYAVSVDLPFAQARWCGDAHVDAVKSISDYNGAEFGRATGTFIEALALLTRAVIIVDADDTVVYIQYVPEIADPPDYESAYACIEQLVNG
ncbi:MAG: thiol peroxidase [Actinomycetia bacterium]|nr:thiol peroxidase [Actinomycetes bacterium]